MMVFPEPYRIGNGRLWGNKCGAQGEGHNRDDQTHTRAHLSNGSILGLRPEESGSIRLPQLHTLPVVLRHEARPALHVHAHSAIRQALVPRQLLSQDAHQGGARLKQSRKVIVCMRVTKSTDTTSPHLELHLRRPECVLVRGGRRGEVRVATNHVPRGVRLQPQHGRLVRVINAPVVHDRQVHSKARAAGGIGRIRASTQRVQVQLAALRTAHNARIPQRSVQQYEGDTHNQASTRDTRLS